jgi:hypothetical protein
MTRRTLPRLLRLNQWEFVRIAVKEDASSALAAADVDPSFDRILS